MNPTIENLVEIMNKMPFSETKRLTEYEQRYYNTLLEMLEHIKEAG